MSGQRKAVPRARSSSISVLDWHVEDGFTLQEKGISQMSVELQTPLPGIVYATGEEPIFKPGDAIRIRERKPIGHYRVPIYLRGKKGVVELVIEPPAMVNKLTYYERWIVAFSNILFRKGILTPTELALKMQQVETARRQLGGETHQVHP
jgi:Nitrile hydratase beta subunit